MDRSRIIITLILILTVIAIILGLSNIIIAGKESEFAQNAQNFFTSGRSGIALIPVRGTIIDGRGGSGHAGSDRIINQLRKARTDSSIRGVILDINSPGGAVGATKKIYDEVIRLRESDKPVVAIISDIAASGGYYVASGADRIFAYPGSIIGSIGVISFHVNLSGLLSRYGIRVTVIKSGKYKDASYPFRQMTGEELSMRRRVQNAAYKQFIRDVAEGRKERISDVERKWANARIFSGEMARREKLIDEFGGQVEAVEWIKKTLKTSSPLPVFTPRRNFFEDLIERLPFLKHNNPLQQLMISPALYYYPSSPELALDIIKDVQIGPGLSTSVETRSK